MDRSLAVDEIFEYKYMNTRVPFAYLKHIWDTGRRQEAFDGLKKYIQVSLSLSLSLFTFLFFFLTFTFLLGVGGLFFLSFLVSFSLSFFYIFRR